MFKKLRALMSVDHIVQITVSALVFAAILIPLTDNIIGANYSRPGGALAGPGNISGVTQIVWLLVPFLVVVAFVIMLTKEV